MSPLFIAAQYGHGDVVKQLAAAGARTGVVLTDNGATDLWAANWKGHADVVQYLLGCPGVEFDRSSTATGPETTPLEIAQEGSHTEVVAMLTAAGAK